MESDTIICLICKAKVKDIEKHLKRLHEEWDKKQYEHQYGTIEDQRNDLKEEKENKIEKKSIERKNPKKGINFRARNLDGEYTGKRDIYIKKKQPHDNWVPEREEFYIFDDSHLETLATCLKKNETCLLTGPPGSGKTSHIMMMASALNWGVEPVNCIGELTAEDLMGKWILVGGHMTWVDGPVSSALRNGKILILNEFDMLKPEVPPIMHDTVMTKQSALTLEVYKPGTKEVVREIIPRHKDFRFMATANTIGKGDEKYQFHGTELLNQSTLDRFRAIIQFDYLKPKQESALLLAKTKTYERDKNGKLVIDDTSKQPIIIEEGITEEVATQMVEVANDVRSNHQSLNTAFTLRRLEAWADWSLRKHMPEATALTILNFMTRQDAEAVKAVIQRKMNINIDPDINFT